MRDMDVFDEMRLEDIINDIKELVKNETNDMKLGMLVRMYVKNNLK
jgi:hypothetical protein